MGNSENNLTSKWKFRIIGGLALVVIVLVIRLLTMSPPQIGTDEEVFKSVDALFTAVTSHRQKQLDECELRLADHLKNGKLRKEAADALNSIIRQARSGKWDPAAQRLYQFMLGQRRA